MSVATFSFFGHSTGCRSRARELYTPGFFILAVAGTPLSSPFPSVPLGSLSFPSVPQKILKKIVDDFFHSMPLRFPFEISNLKSEILSPLQPSAFSFQPSLPHSGNPRCASAGQTGLFLQ